MKTYEYIWLDGYQPEPQMRSKVSLQKMRLHRTGLLMVHPHNKQKEAAQIVYFYQCRLMQIPTP